MAKQTLKFAHQNNPDFIIELRKKVKDYFERNQLSKYGNPSIVTKTVIMGALYILPFTLMLTGIINSPLLILFSFIVMGLGMAGLGMVVMHDANHGSFSKHPLVNKILSNSLFLLGGLPATWQHQHNTLHHGFTNIDGHDGDIDPMGLLRFSPHKPLLKIHRFQHWYAWFFYGLMTISWITTKDFKQMINYKNDGVTFSGNKSFRRIMIELIVSKILYYLVFLVLPIVLLPISWYFTLLFFFIMHFVAGLILSSIFQSAHVMPSSAYPLPDDKGNLENNWAVHQLLTTTDYAPKSKVFSWLVGGLNFQAVHHLFPNICHVHYQNLAPIVKETAAKHGLPYYVQPSFFQALKNHALMLKNLGRATA